MSIELNLTTDVILTQEDKDKIEEKISNEAQKIFNGICKERVELDVKDNGGMTEPAKALLSIMGIMEKTRIFEDDEAFGLGMKTIYRMYEGKNGKEPTENQKRKLRKQARKNGMVETMKTLKY